MPVFLLAATAAAQTPPPDQSKPPESTEAGKSEAQQPLRIAGDLTPPRPIYYPDPKYSDEARNAGYQGICVLWVVIGADGIPQEIKVARSIGMGLDEEAVKAVRTWRFEPATRNGMPVPVQINVEVNFHLDRVPDGKIAQLWNKAKAGDAKAQLELARAYFKGDGIPRNDELGHDWLVKAANQALKQAQFLLAEHYYSPPAGSPDYLSAYMWYSLARRSGEKKSDKKLQELTRKMSPEQLAEAQSRVANWKPTSSK